MSVWALAFADEMQNTEKENGMKNWSRLILPLCLGLVAAGLNFATLKNRLEPEFVVALTRTVAAGERIREGDLQPVEVPRNVGNGRHFWLWETRQQLLGGTTAAVRLEAGDLIPRDVFLRESEPMFSIPEGYAVLSIRVSEEVVTRELRYRLRPGRPVSILLAHETVPLENIQLASLEMVPGDASQPGRMDWYQIGLFVRRDGDLASRLVSGEIVSLVAAGEGS